MTRKSRPGAAKLHLFMSRLLLLGLALQLYGAVLMFYGSQSLHRTSGNILIVAALLNLGICAVAHGWRRETKWSAGLFLLLLYQPVAVFVLASVSPILGATHGVSAFVAILVAWGLSREGVAASEAAKLPLVAPPFRHSRDGGHSDPPPLRRLE